MQKMTMKVQGVRCSSCLSLLSLLAVECHLFASVFMSHGSLIKIGPISKYSYLLTFLLNTASRRQRERCCVRSTVFVAITIFLFVCNFVCNKHYEKRLQLSPGTLQMRRQRLWHFVEFTWCQHRAVEPSTFYTNNGEFGSPGRTNGVASSYKISFKR